MTNEYGTILDVSTVNLGAQTTADAAAGAMFLQVSDASPFREDGGQVRVNDVVLDYVGSNPEVPSLDLFAALPADVAADTPVEAWPLAPTKTALVALATGEQGGEPVSVILPTALAAVVPDGFRDPGAAETVLVGERGPGELVIVDLVAAQPVVELETLPTEVLDNALDGLPPASSPNPVVEGMIGALHVRWAAIENHDLVTYEVHISESDGFVPGIGGGGSAGFGGGFNQGFIPGQSAAVETLVVETQATSTTIRTLPTNLVLAYDTTYYVKIIATDGDGAGPVSVQGSGQILKADQESISANYVYAGRISAPQIDGGEFTGELAILGAVRFGAEGAAGGDLSAGGLTLYGPDGIPTTDLSTDGQSVFKGDAEIDGLTVKSSMSVRGTANELSTGAELELAGKITQGSTAPTVVQTWDSITFTKSGDATFNPANLTSITRSGALWVCGYDDGATYRFYRFNADGTFNSLAADSYATGQDCASTQIVANGPMYSIKYNGDVVKHAATQTYTFSEDFPSAPINATTWPDQVNASWDAGRAKVTGWGQVTTAGIYAMEDNFVSAKIVKAGSGGTTVMQIYHTPTIVKMAEISVTGTTLSFEGWNPYTDTSNGVTSITYSATTHAYWKISESGGTWHFWTSPDGVTWTQRLSQGHGLASSELDNAIFEFEGRGNSHIMYVDTVRHGLTSEDLTVPYARINTSQRPAIGHDGVDILIAEAHPTNNTIRIQALDADTLAVFATVTTGANSGFVGPLAGILKGSFDFGATRFVVKTPGLWYTFNSSGVAQNGETFPADNGGSKWITWDGTNFWALGTDGKLYKHTSIRTADVASTVPYCAAFTWYDSVGTTHETTVSPVADFTLKKRAKVTVTSPAIPPGGGVDDINSVRFYLGPLSSTLTLQTSPAAGVTTKSYDALTTGGASPPGVNTFPAAMAARIVNAGDTLVISGDGSIVAEKIRATGHYVGEAFATTANTFTVSTVTDIIGATLPVPVASVDDVFEVFGFLEIQNVTIAGGDLVGRLNVNGVEQARTLLHNSKDAAGTRRTQMQRWRVTGLAAGTRTFKLTVSGPVGVYQINTTRTAITVEQRG